MRLQLSRSKIKKNVLECTLTHKETIFLLPSFFSQLSWSFRRSLKHDLAEGLPRANTNSFLVYSMYDLLFNLHVRWSSSPSLVEASSTSSQGNTIAQSSSSSYDFVRLCWRIQQYYKLHITITIN